MARLNTYTTDTDVAGNDKVLGTDNGGATKNYTLDSIADYFTRSNVLGVGGQVTYRFQSAPADYVDGDFMLGAGGGVPIKMEDITSIYISKDLRDGTTAEQFLRRIFDSTFKIFGAADKNVYGEYTVTSITEDASSLLIDVVSINSLGLLVINDYYSFVDNSGGDKNYTHTQGSASATWDITHNLDKRPSVSVQDSAGSDIVGQVTYTDNNSLTITFSGATSGKAYLN